ncbi:winged helix-turn-helix domain-containing protein [Flagellimonas flava]|uniref:DNA-binding winged helix-turn-helix (WHTH) domain-containing protein n=1 Tax=Flagellimonas flava TaxID=570519 RepID=A0A1M5K8R1_9FLAO|nr:transcriptional regulator [Allomuricauda flava]SHG49224.1 DNA-binding winged helix-turn-helix (wHTH) domain-containing protein [Allomuricauda flava]
MQSQKSRYQIGHWIFDPTSLELKTGKKTVMLQNQIVKVLQVLIGADGQVVSKEQLLQNVWNGTIVTSNSLDKTISQLRKALGDSPTNPEFIETIPRRGYRFIASVKRIEAEQKLETLVEPTSWLKWAIPFIIIVLLSSILISKKNADKDVLSPNGNYVATLKKEGIGYALLLKNLQTGTSEKLDSFPKPESIVADWSYDNNHLIYNTTREEDEFHALNIYNLPAQKRTFIKFPKHEDGTIPSIDAKLPMLLLEHQKKKLEDNSIHYIKYTQNDTIKVLFNDGIISDFEW